MRTNDQSNRSCNDMGTYNTTLKYTKNKYSQSIVTPTTKKIKANTPKNGCNKKGTSH